MERDRRTASPRRPAGGPAATGSCTRWRLRPGANSARPTAASRSGARSCSRRARIRRCACRRCGRRCGRRGGARDRILAGQLMASLGRGPRRLGYGTRLGHGVALVEAADPEAVAAFGAMSRMWNPCCRAGWWREGDRLGGGPHPFLRTVCAMAGAGMSYPSTCRTHVREQDCGKGKRGVDPRLEGAASSRHASGSPLCCSGELRCRVGHPADRLVRNRYHGLGKRATSHDAIWH